MNSSSNEDVDAVQDGELSGSAAGNDEGSDEIVIDGPRSLEDAAALRQRNLAHLQRVQPQLYNMIQAYQPNTELVFLENGEPDIRFQNTYLYKGEGAYTYCKNHLERYFKSPARIVIGMDAFRATCPDSQRMVKAVNQRLEEAGIDLDHSRSSLETYFLASFGIGLGVHLKEMARISKCHYLIAVEPNLEFFWHSLSVCDWADLVGERAGDTVMQFAFSKEPLELAQIIQSTVRTQSPTAVDGMYLYQHYNNTAFQQAVQRIANGGMAQALMGLGFFEDELSMIAQTYENLRAGEWKIFGELEEKTDLPVFIVGNGPSLDNLLPFIKENADKAAIIACGSALDALMANGVTPDYMVMIERDPKLLNDQHHSLQLGDTRDIVFIGASNVYPGVPRFHDRRIFFFRNGISSAPLFSRSPSQNPANADPIVANAALAFAHVARFKEVYFLGVDAGARDAQHHHSKDSQYTTRQVKFNHDFNIKTEGNFGGTIMSTSILMWSKQALEGRINNFAMRTPHYNLSDGARITGANPRHFSTVKLPETTKEKSEVLADLYERFPTYTKNDFDAAWKEASLFEVLKGFRDEIVRIFTKMDPLDGECVKAINAILKPAAQPGPAQMVYRGSFWQAMGYVYSLANRLRSNEDREKARQIVREEGCRLIEEMCEDALEHFQNLVDDKLEWTTDPEKVVPIVEQQPRIRKQRAAD